MGQLTTHVLDTTHGCPGAGITVELFRVEGAVLTWLGRITTNMDGRCDLPLLAGEDYQSGTYQLQFEVGDYFRAMGQQMPDSAFLDVVVLRFGLDAEQEYYHVPLLVSPYGYSVYRGS